MINNLSNEEIILKRKKITRIRFPPFYKKKSTFLKKNLLFYQTQKIKRNLKQFPKKLFEKSLSFLFYFFLFAILFFFVFFISVFYIQNKNCILNKEIFGSIEKCTFKFINDEWFF